MLAGRLELLALLLTTLLSYILGSIGGRKVPLINCRRQVSVNLNIMQMEYLFLYSFYEVHKGTIHLYIDLRDCVPDFQNNFPQLM